MKPGLHLGHDAELVAALTKIVGSRHVLTRAAQQRPYLTGIRFGRGKALAVVQPGSLVALWQVLEACVEAGAIVIAQAANTGLTGGSTPDGDDYDRAVVLISMRRLAKVHVIHEGRQVICLPGATLYQLERLLEPLGRAPHSEIGSSCIGASVIGGICNNSGGALLRRGPAYTEQSLHARVEASGALHLVNHLDIRLPASPEEALARIESGHFGDSDILQTASAASDARYAMEVRDVDADTPARYNADTSRLYEASGCAGKLVVLAVRLDTFPREKQTKVFYVGTHRPEPLTALRRQVLRHHVHLPIAAEYMHRGAFDLAARYGKDLFWLIRWVGTQHLPTLFALRNRLDACISRLTRRPSSASDRLLQGLARLLPPPLGERLRELSEPYEHHLVVKVPEEAAAEMRASLERLFGRGGSAVASSGTFLECSDDEGQRLFLHRFVAASAANRYRAVHAGEVEDIVAFDVALRRNDPDWFDRPPPRIASRLVHDLHYGHFFCHVFHQDYIVRKGEGCESVKNDLAHILDAKRAKYPAEHNVGHLYKAEPQLADFYRKLDPCNCLNPGVGKMSKSFGYRDSAPPQA